MASFEFTLKTDKVGTFEEIIKYVINEKHEFEFKIIANIQHIQLELSKTFVKM